MVDARAYPRHLIRPYASIVRSLSSGTVVVHHGHTLNVSMGGAFIVLGKVPFDVGDAVEVGLSKSKDRDSKTVYKAIVRWIAKGKDLRGCGVEFDESLSSAAMEEFEELLRRED